MGRLKGCSFDSGNSSGASKVSLIVILAITVVDKPVTVMKEARIVDTPAMTMMLALIQH